MTGSAITKKRDKDANGYGRFTNVVVARLLRAVNDNDFPLEPKCKAETVAAELLVAILCGRKYPHARLRPVLVRLARSSHRYLMLRATHRAAKTKPYCKKEQQALFFTLANCIEACELEARCDTELSGASSVENDTEARMRVLEELRDEGDRLIRQLQDGLQTSICTNKQLDEAVGSLLGAH